MSQLENSIPKYKKKLMRELKARVGRNVVPLVSASSTYSSSFVRAWFKNAKINDKIKDSACNLLEELKQEEAQLLVEVSQ